MKRQMKCIEDVRNRRQRFMRRLFMPFLALIICSAYLLWASESITCKPYTEKELTSIKASNDANLIMGSGVVDLLSIAPVVC
jgi:hypothetical protein